MNKMPLELIWRAIHSVCIGLGRMSTEKRHNLYTKRNSLTLAASYFAISLNNIK